MNWIMLFLSPFCSDNYLTLPAKLLCFLVRSMFLAKLAILFELDAVGRVLFVFVRPVVAIFAFGAGQGDVRPHDLTSQNFLVPSS